MMKVFQVHALVFFLSQVLESIWSILDSAPTKYASKSGLFRTCMHQATCHVLVSIHRGCAVCRTRSHYADANQRFKTATLLTTEQEAGRVAATGTLSNRDRNHTVLA